MHLGIDNVREASTAAQCLSACKEKEFNIIFLDIELPDGDGKEIISQINEISPEANVVMVSAHSTVENVKEAIEKGAKGFVVKPFTIFFLVKFLIIFISAISQNIFVINYKLLIISSVIFFASANSIKVLSR